MRQYDWPLYDAPGQLPMTLVGEARRHPAASLVVLSMAIVILANAALAGDFGRALLYFGAIAASIVSIDLVLGRWPARGPMTIVRGGAGELVMLTVSWLAAIAWLWARFVRNYQPAPGPARLVWLLIIVGFVFNAVPALWLIARRYGLRDLGLRPGGVQAVPLVILIFAFCAIVMAPGSITWSEIERETGGSILVIVSIALSAAVPEEFFRFVWQTRAGAVLANRATGWLVASVLWAALHGPKNWDDSHSLRSTVMGCLNIVPLGLLWGYLTHRTRSMVPSILLHATNLWGLQNLQ